MRINDRVNFRSDSRHSISPNHPPTSYRQLLKELARPHRGVESGGSSMQRCECWSPVAGSPCHVATVHRVLFGAFLQWTRSEDASTPPVMFPLSCSISWASSPPRALSDVRSHTRGHQINGRAQQYVTASSPLRRRYHHHHHHHHPHDEAVIIIIATKTRSSVIRVTKIPSLAIMMMKLPFVARMMMKH